MINYYIFIYKVLILGLFDNSYYSVIRKHMINKSFKFSNKDNKSIFSLLRIFKKHLNSKIYFNKPVYFLNDNLIFDNNMDSFKERVDFLNFYSQKKKYNLLAYDTTLKFYSINQKLKWILLTIVFSPLFIMSSAFLPKYRASYGLLIEYPIMLANIIDFLKKKKITLFYFNIYELESNLLAHFFLKHNIKFYKITSTTPLGFNNQNILTDGLILCDFIQQDEVLLYNKSIINKSQLTFGPEDSHRYMNFYKTSNNRMIYDIGFYSTASWLRFKEGHLDTQVNMFKNEILVLEELRNIVDEFKVVINLHPREYINKHIKKEAYAYYINILGDNISFNHKAPGNKYFDNYNIGVGWYSTILSERIYAGFKTILKPYDTPLTKLNSNIKSIFLSKKDSLKDQIKKYIKYSDYEFYLEKDILKYTNRF